MAISRFFSSFHEIPFGCFEIHGQNSLVFMVMISRFRPDYYCAPP